MICVVTGFISCGNVKGDWAVRDKWNCDKCKTERVRLLQNDLQNALRLVDELKARNRVGGRANLGESGEEGACIG